VLLGALIGGGAGGVYGAASRHFSPYVAVPGVIEGAFVGLIVSAAQNSNRRYEASNTPDIVAARRVVAAVGVGRDIVVTPRNSGPITGQVRAVGQSDFAIVPDGETKSVQLPYESVEGIRAKGLGVGAKIGLAAGVAFNVVTIWGIAAYK
jgi:hypothetical protein